MSPVPATTVTLGPNLAVIALSMSARRHPSPWKWPLDDPCPGPSLALMDTLFDVTLKLQVAQQLPHVMNGIHHRPGQSSRVLNVDPQERLCSRIVLEGNGLPCQWKGVIIASDKVQRQHPVRHVKEDVSPGVQRCLLRCVEAADWINRQQAKAKVVERITVAGRNSTRPAKMSAASWIRPSLKCAIAAFTNSSAPRPRSGSDHPPGSLDLESAIDAMASASVLRSDQTG